MTVDVAIVGAGLSGLVAADRLSTSGYRTIVFEARDRVGGRTKTVSVKGARIDLGAQWVGPDQHRMLALLDRLDIPTFRTPHRGTKILDMRGERTTYRGEIPSYPPLQLLELQLMLLRIDRLARRIPPEAPWHARGASDLDQITVETLKRRYLRSRRVRATLDAAVRVVWGAEPSEVSALHFLMYINSAGGLMKLLEIDGGAQERRAVTGMQRVSERLAHGLDAEVRLSCPVREIRHDKEGVTLITDEDSCRARHVIVAVPPPLAGRIRYDPMLPSTRSQYLQRAPMGNTIKCFAFYERAFWTEAKYSGEAVHDGDVTVCFDNTTYVAEDGTPLPGDGVPALLCFIVGAAARRWGDRSQAERRRLILDKLVHWFGAEAASPVDYVDHDWSSERWTGGCPVAFHPPGVLTDAGSVLRKPVGRIHWASTETERAWTGFMEGAVEAGEQAAEEIING